MKRCTEMHAKVPNNILSLLDHDRHHGAVQRHLARHRNRVGQTQATPDQECQPARVAAIEDAARQVVCSWMCGKPVGTGIEALRRALGNECLPL